MNRQKRLILAGITLVVGSILVPYQGQAASCDVFKSGTVRTKHMVANGDALTAGVKKKGKVLKVVDANSCAVLAKKQFTRSKKKRVKKIRAGNLWQGDGATASEEIVITEKLGKRRLKVRIYTITTDNTLELVAKKTIRVKKGQSRLSIKNKQLSVNGTPHQLISWKGSAQLRPVSQSLQFFTIGDAGDVGDDKDAVASAMSSIAQQINDISFIGTLGDNFYPPNTISDVEDEDWEANFVEPYNLTGLDVPFHVSLGNHDYDDNDVDAILDYHSESEQWNLPSKYYAFTYPESSASPLVEYIVLDTHIIRNELEGYEEQLDWLESKLENSTAQWTIVAGHHLVYSYGQHGGTSRMEEHVLPLFQTENGPDLYLAGHDHDKQLIDHPDDDVTYMVNGAASRLRDTSQGEHSLFAASTLGFSSFTVTKTKLSIDFYNTDAQSDFQYIVTK